MSHITRRQCSCAAGLLALLGAGLPPIATAAQGQKGAGIQRVTLGSVLQRLATTPKAETWRYGLTIPFHVASKQAAAFVNLGAARAAGGTLTTVPLIFSGRRLEITMSAGAGGGLKVEMLDQHSQPIPAFSGANANDLLGNSVRRTATWSGTADLSSLRGQPIQLRFIGRDVQIYAFQFQQ